MKDYLKNWIPRIKDYGLKLDKLSKLYDQPWVVVTELNDFVKIIFQEDGKLLVSNNGVVSDGSWELVSNASSIMLNINGNKRLYNNHFIDQGVMILKLDGYSTDLFVLVNQNIIPDLDVLNYIEAKYSKPIVANRPVPISISYDKEIQLTNGMVLQIVKDFGNMGSSEVKINHKPVADGHYKKLNSKVVYEIKDSRIKMEYYLVERRQVDGQIIEIGWSSVGGITKDCPVWLNGENASDGTYKTGWFSKIDVQNGRVVSH